MTDQPSLLPAVPFGLPEPNDWFTSEEKSHHGTHRDQLRRRAERLEQFAKVKALLMNAVFRAGALARFKHGHRYDLRLLQDAGVDLLRSINTDGVTYDRDHAGPSVPELVTDSSYQGRLKVWLEDTQRIVDEMSRLESLRYEEAFNLALGIVATQEAIRVRPPAQAEEGRWHT